MKVLFVNPHRSDFVYNSPMYSLIKRRSLKKYAYLDIFFKSNSTDYFFATTTLITILSNFKLNFLNSFFVKFENRLFQKINKINSPIFKLDFDKYYELAFCFGFSIRDLSNKQFKEITNKSKIVFIHLSHYHIYPNKLIYWSEFDNVVFCADVDIRESYFYNYFLNNKTSFFILSYTIDSTRFKFNIPTKNRESNIVCTGTFHEYEKIYNISYLKQNFISNIFGFLTIHPERRMIYYFRHKLKYITVLNSSMGKLSFFRFFKKDNSINQSNYFQLDIVELYNKFKYAFIGEESITGLPGIGVFEAILCGCIPIINEYCYKGTPIEKSSIPIKYSNMNNLFYLINNFESKIITNTITDDELLSFRNEVSNFFSASNQLFKLNEQISKYI